jgi:flagellar FliL protein
MCSVAIELSDEKLAEVLTSRDAELRDVVLRVLGTKTVDELSDMAHRETLKDEVRVALDELMKKKGAIRRLYFPQFVIQ